MALLGLDFRPPKKGDRDAWRIVEGLYENGFAFLGCGCNVSHAPPPRTVRELQGWLERETSKRPQSEGARLLATIAARAASG